MLIVLLSWIYILVICLTAGSAVFAVLEHLFPLSHAHSLTGIVTTGIVALTVYAEYFSLFAGVGGECHVMMLIGLGICVLCSRRTRKMLIKKAMRLKDLAKSPTGLVLLGLVLFLAFYTSRGNFHTDTGIYHAAAIRWNEEYGTVLGQANIDLHYGYNSAYLLFCSLFTFSWIPGFGATAPGGGTLALHTTTGFLAALYLSYACRRLRFFLARKSHLADAARIALIIYVFTNATGLMSPATDYGTLLVSGYLVCAWLDIYENDQISQHRALYTPMPHIYEYGLLSMLALFAVSMKLSCAAMFLLVLYPLAVLIRKRAWRHILQFVLLGVLIFLPFLIRNVILTGWLFYPFEAIDLFDVAWKVPYEYSKVDSDQIKVWGRCLYDVSKADLGILEWLPIWWEGQSDYGQMLLYGMMLSPFLFLVDLALMLGRGERPRMDLVLHIVSLYVSVLLWFMTAPFIRYGLTFLLVLPILPVFLFIDLCAGGTKGRISMLKVPGVFLAGGLLVCCCAWIDHYANDDLSFVKQHMTEPYYITQKAFDTRDEDTVTIENAEGTSSMEIYTAGDDSVNSYYAFPGTCYDFMTERSRMLGDSIKDGFAAR